MLQEINDFLETEYFYKDIAGDVETRFNTSGYKDRPLPVGKNKKVIGLMKDELGGEIMKEFISLRPKMYSYRVGNAEPKKYKGIKKCVMKKTITFDDYKDYLFKGRNVYKSQLLFRSDRHEIKTLEVNKLALNSQDDKRISIDGIASYAMGHYKLKNGIYNERARSQIREETSPPSDLDSSDSDSETDSETDSEAERMAEQYPYTDSEDDD